MFLYDLKAIDENIHIKYTGQSNKIILDNLLYIDSMGCKTEIRIPLVPEANKEEIPKMAQFMARLKNLEKARVLPYHNYAKSKYDSLDMENTLPKILPAKEEISEAIGIIKSYGIKVVE